MTGYTQSHELVPVRTGRGVSEREMTRLAEELVASAARQAVQLRVSLASLPGGETNPRPDSFAGTSTTGSPSSSLPDL